MRAALFVSALFAALAASAPNAAPEPEGELGIMPRACPGIGAHCGDGQHWVCLNDCVSLSQARYTNNVDIVPRIGEVQTMRCALLKTMLIEV